MHNMLKLFYNILGFFFNSKLVPVVLGTIFKDWYQKRFITYLAVNINIQHMIKICSF